MAGDDTEDDSQELPESSAVVRGAHVGALAVYRRVPTRLKRMLVGWTTPSFQVAAGLIVRRADGALLLVRHSYRKGWGLPGGLLKRNEHPRDAATREALEELGVDVDLDGEPIVIIVPEERRITVVFRARLRPGSESPQPSPRSPEIAEVAWFPLDDLPRVQPDVAQAIVDLGLGPPPRRV